jgi:glucose-6-phosphate 1-dehydrogenase
MKSFDIVIFGGSGDLTLRKLMPAFYFLHLSGRLSKDSRIIGLAREDIKDYGELVRSHLKIHLADDYDDAGVRNFIRLLKYRCIDVTSASEWPAFSSYLSPDSDGEILYYMAVPPVVFKPIFEGLKRQNLNLKTSRVIVEKPLGEDEKTAKEVNELLADCFTEQQIYRIDHYLGKETVQNLTALRFSNSLLSAVWHKDHIKNIQITVAETVGVEGRGEYLNRAGILRDMVQNHLLQIVSYLAMEPPTSLSADDVRDEKLRVLQALEPITKKNVQSHVVRAQYERSEIGESYREELAALRADKSSKTSENHKDKGETFTAIKAMINNERWQGVPFYLRTGKKLKNRFAQVVVHFKSAPHNIYNSQENNKLIIDLQPAMAVTLNLSMKEIGGTDVHLRQAALSCDLLKDVKGRLPDAYEKLIADVLAGNQAHFVRYDEIKASWKWIDGIRAAWAQSEEEGEGQMEHYPAGSMGPSASDILLNSEGDEWYGN